MSKNDDLVESLMESLSRYTDLLNKKCDALESEVRKKTVRNTAEQDSDEALQAQENLPKLLKPIQELLNDNKISDILINSYKSIFVEIGGKVIETDAKFKSESDLMDLAKTIAKSIGRNLTSEKPYIDARLPDGSRVNIVTPPLSLDGVAISIRKFPEDLISLDKVVDFGMMSQDMSDFLKICGRSKVNILIVGGTGVGKTTLLNGIAQYVSEDDRVVTIEDSAELKLPIKHVVRLETKPKTPGIKNSEVTIRELVINALRMRPDRIIVGEVRADEAFDMIQAINTGHEGSMTTVHANSPREALLRLESMITLAVPSLSSYAIKQRIASSFELLVMISRMDDGSRKVTSITEIAGMEKETVITQELFKYDYKDSFAGKMQGEFINKRIVPRFSRKAKLVGLDKDMSLIFTKRSGFGKAAVK